MHGEIIASLLSFNILCIYCHAVESSVSILPVGICNIEILCYNNHPLKYHNYCKYYDIYLIDYNCYSAVKTKSQAYSINLYHMSRNIVFIEYFGIENFHGNRSPNPSDKNTSTNLLQQIVFTTSYCLEILKKWYKLIVTELLPVKDRVSDVPFCKPSSIHYDKHNLQINHGSL